VSQVIVDTGPLVALLNSRDAHHIWAREAFAGLEPPLLTCEPVLTEASYLVRKLPGGSAAVLELVGRGVLDVRFRVDAELLALRTLVTKYASVPMSLADACLVRMAELHPRAAVLTLDSDFGIYRRSGRLQIPIITPLRLIRERPRRGYAAARKTRVQPRSAGGVEPVGAAWPDVVKSRGRST
jgi:predicted nucleic acid-binding protein